MLDNTYGFRTFYTEKMIELETDVKNNLMRKTFTELEKIFDEEGYEYKSNMSDMLKCIDELTSAIVKRLIHD